MSVITVLVEPSSQQTTDGFQKLELVLPRTWHTKGVKRKCGKLQLKYGSLSEGSQAIGGAGGKEILSRQYDRSIVFLIKTDDAHACA